MKIRKKRVWSIILAFAMIIPTMPQMAVKTQAAEAVCYVDGTNGSDANDGSESAPYQTINKAVDSLNWTSPEDDKTIYIKGVYDWTDSSVSGHGGLVIIKGADDTAQLNISNTIRLTTGSLKIENIKMHYSDNGIYIVQNNNELTIGEGVTTSGASGGWWQYMANIGMGTYQGTTSNMATPVLSLSGGEFYNVFLGSSVITTGAERANPGADFILNPGSFAQNVVIGGNGWDGNWGTNRYTDNVNLTFNGGNINNYVDISGHSGYWKGTTDFGGNAVQLIYNNGTYDRMGTKVKFTQSDVEEMNGVYYQIKCANLEGSLIQTTDTAGKYMVEGNMTAKATNVETNEVVYSEDGVLTVPAAGIYDVEWVAEAPATDVTRYVDAVNGSDANTGKKEAPLKTINKAIDILESITAENKMISIVGDYAWKDNNVASHSQLITIKGEKGAKLTISNNINILGGPLKLENITLYYIGQGTYINQNGNEVIYGEDVVITGDKGSWDQIQPNLGTGSYGQSMSYKQSHKMTVNAGNYYNVFIGDSVITTGVVRTIPGADFVMNGGFIYRLYIAGNGWDGNWGTNKYTDNVNLTFNGGTIGMYVALAGHTDYFVGGIDFDKNAVQIICNNGTNPTIGINEENVAAQNGVFYRINCPAYEGSSLETTEEAGVYHIVGNMAAIAVNENDSNDVYASVDGVLTIKNPGTYNIAWEKEEAANLYYVSADGNDNNSGKTAEQPFASITKAVEQLNKSKLNNKRVIILGTVSMPEAVPVHHDMIIIEGDKSGNSVLRFNQNCSINGPLTIRNIGYEVTADNVYLVTGDNDIVLGEDLINKGSREIQTVYAGTDSYINTGTQIIINSDCTIDLSKQKHKEQDGKLFVGWADSSTGAGVNGDTFMAGTILEARYIDYNKASDFVFVGTQIKKVETGESQELKFRTSINGTILSQLNDAVYGVVYLQTELLQGAELELDGQYTYEGTDYFAKSAQITKPVVLGEGVTEYCAVIEDINSDNYKEQYAAKGYVIYKDINGFEQILYSDAMETSVCSTARKALDITGATAEEKEYLSGFANEKAQYVQYRKSLKNTYEKLTNDKKLRIVYFGGSVTAGYGSTEPDKYSWRALSGEWFKANFPDADITTINTAIGESGTYLGTYRAQKDVIQQKPDLLFVEYAINDRYKGIDQATAAMQYETIIREVKRALPNCDIVTLLVTDNEVKELYKGELYPTARGHEEIAKAYNISTINVGQSLLDSMHNQSDKEEWAVYFMDVVHPTNAGYQRYYECVEEYLRNSLLYTNFDNIKESNTLPPVQSESLLDGNRKEYIGEEMKECLVAFNGFGFSNELYYGPEQTPHMGYYFSNASDREAYIEFKFTGTEFSMWTNFYTDSMIEYSIDGGNYISRACERHAPTQIVAGLAPGEHTIRIKPITYGSNTSDIMKIGAIFMRDETQATKKGTID